MVRHADAASALTEVTLCTRLDRYVLAYTRIIRGTPQRCRLGISVPSRPMPGCYSRLFVSCAVGPPRLAGSIRRARADYAGRRCPEGFAIPRVLDGVPHRS